MSATADHDRISSIYYDAIQRPIEQREAFVNEACGGDEALLAAVNELLDGEDQIADVLKTGVLSCRIRSELQRMPERIGSFEIREKLGEGGMGVVYRAVQRQPLRREVAIKLIRDGFQTEQILARFESERQALALMSHPGIAHVLEAGATPDGRSYIVMEYAPGVPITAYCEANGLTIRQRLEAFLEVCDAVQHAHHKGIVHRDLKPSNILVTTSSGTPRPKVIDFGVARALERPLSDRAQRTEVGQLVGTPDYMSPEQAAMDDRAIDTRTDIYSLGVLLYEMLTGERPFSTEELVSGGLDGARRIIRERDPVRPSARVEGALARQLRGDLDWITLRALQKEPARRYGSANEFAADIQRHLRNEPVLASPPSRVYHLRKFVGKHRVAVGFAAMVVLVLTGVTTMALVQARRIANAKDRADASWQQAVRKAEGAVHASTFLVGIFDMAEDRDAIHRQLGAAAQLIERDHGGRPADLARLYYPLGQIYHNLGFPEGTPLMDGALRDMQQAMGPDDPEVLALAHARAKRLSTELQHEQATAMMSEVLERRRRVLGDDHRDTIDSLTWYGRVLGRGGRYDEAQIQLAEAKLRAAATLGDEHPITLRAMSYIAIVALDQRRLEMAEQGLREVIPMWERVMGPAHSTTMSTVYKLGCVRALQGDPDEALDLIQRALAGGWTYAFTEMRWVHTHVALRNDPTLKTLHDHPRFLAMTGPDSPLKALDDARVAARERRIEEGLQYLRTAVDRGFADARALVYDDELISLQGRPEFQQIVEELESIQRSNDGQNRSGEQVVTANPPGDSRR